MFRNIDIFEILLRIPIILISLSVHEFAHGYCAYKLGDSTAKEDGRLSLNPLHHIDPMGLLCMIFFRFGWAKPVMINTRNLKNPKRDMAITAFAGPLSNFILAFIGLMVYYPISVFASSNILTDSVLSFNWELVMVNLSLGAFNLIPFPPLDGSKILAIVLPSRIYGKYLQYERYGFVVLMLLTYSGMLSVILTPIITSVYSGLVFIVRAIYPF